MARRSLGGLVVAALLLTGDPVGVAAQTPPVQTPPAQTPPAGLGDDESSSSLSVATPLLQVGLLIGGAWAGSVIARRMLNSGWVSLIGARIGAGLGLEAAASLGLLGIGVGGALPASRVVAPQLISVPISGEGRGP